MIKSLIKWLFLIVVVWGFALLYYSGYFTTIVIQEKDMGPYTLIYQQATGDYSKVGPIINALYDKFAYDEQIKSERGFWIYYDNPWLVAADQLRSDVGVILEDQYLSQLSRLQSKYTIKTWEKQKSMVAEFPYKGQISIVAGVLKVYPVIKKYVADKWYTMQPVMEIYDKTNKKIYYIVSIK